VAVLAAVMACGCGPRPTAPAGYLPDQVAAQTETYGAWVDFTYARGDRIERFQGELIAVSADTLWVLGATGGVRVPHTALRAGRLTHYDSSAGTVGGLAFLGMLSTLSNGAFLVLTAPMWIIGGAVASSSQANVAGRDIDRSSGPQLAAFARFPGGLPEGIELDELRPKPTPVEPR
jgi:hypothetical protein